jgi:hypothetical protein
MVMKAVKDYFNLNKGMKTNREKYLAEQEALEIPWANFEITGFEKDNRVKVTFHWNDAFIAKCKELGFQAETEEDTVQLFFYASQLRPTELSGGDNPVQSEEHPALSSQQNVLRT